MLSSYVTRHIAYVVKSILQDVMHGSDIEVYVVVVHGDRLEGVCREAF